MNIDPLFDQSIPLQDAVNQLLRPLISSFKATTSAIVDNGGRTIERFSTVVHNQQSGTETVAIDSVAAVIECVDELTVPALQDAYRHIKDAKSLRKTDRPDPENGEVQMTTGIIVARGSKLLLDDVSTEMSRLNKLTASHYWPDAVAVLNGGIVSYSAHMPGREEAGDFFLPAEAITVRSPAPSVWVQKVIRPVENLAFNKVASLIVARVAIFQPGIKVPDYKELIKELPSHAAATETYQFNLANTLVPMTKEQAIAAQLPQDTFNIVSGKEKLGSVQYQSWQDGGVFIVRGGFPLDIFLIFLRQVVPNLPTHGFQYFRGKGVQVSYVLPVSKQQFFQTLSIFEQRSSNISIQRETAKFLVQRIGDEGSASPFVARLMLGLLTIRDSVYYDKAEREHFDELYEAVLSGLRGARETSQDIAKEWEQHRAKIESGAVVSTRGRAVQITESIDRSLKRDLESFLNAAVRTIKHSLQVIAKDLGVEIGFLFQKESTFQAGIARTRAFDPTLADYLLATRKWSEPLVLMRNDLEHGTIPSPKVIYTLDTHPTKAEEPRFDGKPLAQFTNEVLDRICCFAEEIIIYCLRKKLPIGFDIAEVPLADRDKSAPVRFFVTITPGGRPPWVLIAHAKKFAEV